MARNPATQFVWLLGVMLFWSAAAAGEPADTNDDKTGVPGPLAAFEKLKTLQGAWDEAPWSDEGGGRRVVEYRLTGNGTSLIEEYSGEPTMTTVYHMDGDELRMTHFCNAGNQPRMKAASCDGGDSIQFDFVDVTNLSTPHAYHTRTLRVEFIDEDHVDLHFIGLKEDKDVPGTVSLTRRQ